MYQCHSNMPFDGNRALKKFSVLFQCEQCIMKMGTSESVWSASVYMKSSPQPCPWASFSLQFIWMLMQFRLCIKRWIQNSSDVKTSIWICIGWLASRSSTKNPKKQSRINWAVYQRVSNPCWLVSESYHLEMTFRWPDDVNPLDRKMQLRRWLQWWFAVIHKTRPVQMF